MSLNQVWHERRDIKVPTSEGRAEVRVEVEVHYGYLETSMAYHEDFSVGVTQIFVSLSDLADESIELPHIPHQGFQFGASVGREEWVRQAIRMFDEACEAAADPLTRQAFEVRARELKAEVAA